MRGGWKGGLGGGGWEGIWRGSKRAALGGGSFVKTFFFSYVIVKHVTLIFFFAGARMQRICSGSNFSNCPNSSAVPPFNELGLLTGAGVRL